MNATAAYAIGKNESGQFGLNNRNPLTQLILIHNAQNIESCSCGASHIIYSDNNQTYWAAGDNTYGQCGVEDKEQRITKLREISYFKTHQIKIKKVCTSVGGSRTFWITSTNNLYGNGDNSGHKLGIKGYRHNEPALIPDLHHVIDVQSAACYSIALCGVDGDIDVIVRGWCRLNIYYQENNLPQVIFDLIVAFHGQCTEVFSTSHACGNGFGKHHKSNGKWNKIQSLGDKHIVKIQTGTCYSMFLSEDGSVWCCGENSFGELGLGDVDNRYEPVHIPYFKEHNIKIKDIKCGWYHTLAISEDKVFSWGQNGVGQCAPKKGETSDMHIPKEIIFFSNRPVKSIGCGVWHSYVGTVKGEHYMFGSNDYDQCIQSDDGNAEPPYLINKHVEEKCHKVVKEVHLGYSVTIVIV